MQIKTTRKMMMTMMVAKEMKTTMMTRISKLTRIKMVRMMIFNSIKACSIRVIDLAKNSTHHKRRVAIEEFSRIRKLVICLMMTSLI